MKKLICLTILILLSGCSSTTPASKSTSKQPAASTVTSHVKPTKKTVPKATLSTLVGHAFVQVDNRKKAIYHHFDKVAGKCLFDVRAIRPTEL